MYKNETIFTVTVVDSRTKSHKVGADRVVGWFPTYEDAEKAVVNNAMDMCECGSYDYALIEEVVPGIYPFCSCEDQKWFKIVINKEDDDSVSSGNIKFEKCDTPEQFKRICNFAIG